MTPPLGAGERERELVLEWRRFANDLQVVWQGFTRSWRDHVSGQGFEDEVRLIQPTVFRAFVTRFLAFEVAVNLSPEQPGEVRRSGHAHARATRHASSTSGRSLTRSA